MRFALFACLTAMHLTACLSPARESELGDQAAEQVEKEMGLVRDAKALAYVRAIGNRLAAVSERPEGPWHFEIAASPEPNAFALPGGHVYVTRGLLALVNSEDELAGVIGHEIGHVTARHSVKRVSANILTAPVSIASAVAGFGVGLVSPLLRNVVLGTGQIVTEGFVVAPYSRSQENEADEIGQGLAARAGYDPAGISSFMRTLVREGELRSPEGRRFHILDTHPMPAARARKTEERALTLTRAKAAPVARSTAALYGKLDGLLVGPDPALGVFRKSLFLHPELGLVVDFPKGWKTLNTPAAAGAVSPDRDAVVALRLAATDETLDDVLKELEAEAPSLRFERSRIHGRPAARAIHTSRGNSANITLIRHRQNVYSIVGQSAASDAEQFAPAFGRTARSFRGLTGDDRTRIRESRLRVRQARAGDSPAALVKRFGSTWSDAELALANGLEPDARLKSARLVKVAIPQAYSR